MTTHRTTIEVDRPVTTVYDQWTQFEAFPMFMEGVEQVRQLDDARLHWVADIAGQHREWDARITEQVPDRVVAWESTSGTRNAGRVEFEPVNAGRTRVHLELELQPEGVVEQAGDKLGFVGRRAKADLERFKDFIEGRVVESGAWRGEIHQGQTQSSTSSTTGTGTAGTGRTGTAGGSTMTGLGPNDGGLQDPTMK